MIKDRPSLKKTNWLAIIRIQKLQKILVEFDIIIYALLYN